MPWTLWRAILVDVWRLVLLSAGVLVAVIAFAATIKPLADGQLDAAQAIQFMLLAVVPMLAYALPFAAGFGTTLAYHRIAQDNEATAAHASGIGHRSVLFPALLTGLVLAGVIGLLNDQVIPRYLVRMEQMITQDITKIMIRSLASGEAARFKDIEIFADEVQSVEPEPWSPFSQLAKLTSVAALQFDREGNIDGDITAVGAWLMIFPAAALAPEDRAGFDDTDMVVQIKFEDVAGVIDGQKVSSPGGTTPAQAIPSAFNDDPKYLTGSQLRALRGHPEEMNWVRARSRWLARSLAAVQTVGALHERIANSRTLLFDFAGDRGRSLRVQASGITGRPGGWWTLEPLGSTGRVEIEEYLPDGSVEMTSAEHASLSAERSRKQGPFAQRPLDAALTFRLDLEGVRVSSAAGDARITATTELPEASFVGLLVPGDPMGELAGKSTGELLDAAAPYTREDNPGYQQGIAETADSLREMVAKLGREITSKQHERIAMALSCLVMVMTGAVMALRLRTSLPLVVYLWSFFPALSTIVLISSGQSTTHKIGAAIGLPVLYAGVGVLALYTFIVYLLIRRH